MAKTVLIVDDERNIMLSLKHLMLRAGYQVLQASDGEEALEIAEASVPDLILLDVMIPKRDGYDVCQTLRANPAMNHVQIIMLTAKGQEVEIEKGLALGANAYMTKPFSTTELVEKVKSLLGDGSG
ncbi:MAG: response regulator [Pseudomonadota bacterium]